MEKTGNESPQGLDSPQSQPSGSGDVAFGAPCAPIDPAAAQFEPETVAAQTGAVLQPARPTQPFRPAQPQWWYCLRLGAVSGRYEGSQTAPASGNTILDLRVDIDPRHANSPVLNRISGDIYNAYSFNWGGRTYSWRVFNHSWIVDSPNVSWSRCSVTITGQVRRWSGHSLATTVSVTIPWSTFSSAGSASVTFSNAAGQTSYQCGRQSDAFREVNLEVDIAQSVNVLPILPSYDTHWHNTRPAGLPQRILDMESSYREAGIDMTIRAGHSIINDSASQFNSWSVAELHDSMETHFSQIGGSWPKWEMWGLLAGRFDNPGVGGIMFDAAATYGGSGEPPERQGFAVFREHSWFNNLVSGAPANQAQAAAMRKFLYTWVHEAGHAFNFLHSWDKSRPDALSWMNYDWKYDNRNGSGSFWSNFEMRFDTEELLHLRHGDRKSVIMGGDPWASGGHMESDFSEVGMVEGNAPLELMVRSKGYFHFMEPVSVEVRARNLLPDLPMEIDSRFDPSFGALAFQLQKPNGQIVEYEPVFCQLGDDEALVLKGHQDSVVGEDRYSQEVTIDYGKHGHYFSEPGVYRIRAIYQGLGNLLVTSNVHTIRIGMPGSKDEEKLAQDYFSTAAGLAMALGGSRSPWLESGFKALEEVAERCKDSMVGARVALKLAEGFARPFFRTDDSKRMKKKHDAKPKEVLALTSQALKVVRKEEKLNISYHNLVRWRASILTEQKGKSDAKKELAAMRKDLQGRGVNKPVLDDIAAFEKSL